MSEVGKIAVFRIALDIDGPLLPQRPSQSLKYLWPIYENQLCFTIRRLLLHLEKKLELCVPKGRQLKLEMDGFQLPEFHRCGMFKDKDIIHVSSVPLSRKRKQMDKGRSKKKEPPKKKKKVTTTPCAATKATKIAVESSSSSSSDSSSEVELETPKKTKKVTTTPREVTKATKIVVESGSSSSSDSSSEVELEPPMKTKKVVTTPVPLKKIAKAVNSPIANSTDSSTSDSSEEMVIVKNPTPVKKTGTLPYDVVTPLSATSKSLPTTPTKPVAVEQKVKRKALPRSQADKNSYYGALPTVSSDLIKEGDHISFRLLEMGKNWTPRVSFWKEAAVVQLNRKENQITLTSPKQLAIGAKTLILAEGTTQITLELSMLKDLHRVV